VKRAALLLIALAACRHSAPAGDSLKDAQADLAAGRCERALAEFQQASRDGARKLEAIRGRVEAAQKCGQLDALLAERRAADKKSAWEWYELGLAEFAAGNEGQSIEALRKAIELQPKEAELHYRLGVALEAGERWSEARGPLQAAVDLAPKVAHYRAPLALCLGKLGEHAAAIEALRPVPKLSPTAEEANRAVQTARALTDLYKGLPPPDRADLEAALGYLVRDAPGVALPKLEELATRQPDFAAAHALLGLACARLDEAGRAIGELREASRLAPELPQPYAWLAQLYTARERPDLAIPELGNAIARNPLDIESLRALGMIYLARSDAKALEPLEDAVALSPTDPGLRLLLARAEILAGHPDLAETRMEQLAQERPEDAEVLLRLALLLFDVRAHAPEAQRAELGHRIEALAQKVLTLQPQNAMADQLLKKLRNG
jgi:Flp pilus assembly protein TadD